MGAGSIKCTLARLFTSVVYGLRDTEGLIKPAGHSYITKLTCRAVVFFLFQVLWRDSERGKKGPSRRRGVEGGNTGVKLTGSKVMSSFGKLRIEITC